MHFGKLGTAIVSIKHFVYFIILAFGN